MHPILIGIYAAIAAALAILAFLVFEPCRKGTIKSGKALVKDRYAFCRPSRMPRSPMTGGPLPHSVYPDTWFVVISVAGATIRQPVNPKYYGQMSPGTTVKATYGRGIISGQLRIIKLEVE